MDVEAGTVQVVRPAQNAIPVIQGYVIGTQPVNSDAQIRYILALVIFFSIKKATLKNLFPTPKKQNRHDQELAASIQRQQMQSLDRLELSVRHGFIRKVMGGFFFLYHSFNAVTCS